MLVEQISQQNKDPKDPICLLGGWLELGQPLVQLSPREVRRLQ